MRYANLAFGIVAGFAATLTLAALRPSLAAPLSTGAADIKAAVTSDVTDVRWRRRHGWAAGGFATGLALGAIASRPYYYDPYYYGPPPAYYAPPPAIYPEPGYIEPVPAPNGPLRQCWVTTDKDRGFGYYRPC